MPDIRTLGIPITDTVEPYSERLQRLVRVASESISALRVVRSDSATSVVLARWPELESRSPLGISVTAAAPAALVRVQHIGEIEDGSWSWTPGAPVFCGPLGTLTQVMPSTDYALVVGEAVTASRLVVRIQGPIFLAP
jgi:hypothetical protein